MKIVVIGDNELISSQLVRKLLDYGHDAVAASTDTGVNLITGEGLAEALAGAEVVVDVCNSPSFDGAAVMNSFHSSTLTLLDAEAAAGVRHHVALSVVGTERLAKVGFFRAKLAEERLIRTSSIPYSIVHATQFFEFVKSIADATTNGDSVRLPPVLIQPMSAEDVAAAIGDVAAGEPVNGIVEVAGPEEIRLDEFVGRYLTARDDPRTVVADPRARYFGALLEERTLLPASDARLSTTTFEDWLSQPATGSTDSPARPRNASDASAR